MAYSFLSILSLENLYAIDMSVLCSLRDEMYDTVCMHHVCHSKLFNVKKYIYTV